MCSSDLVLSRGCRLYLADPCFIFNVSVVDDMAGPVVTMGKSIGILPMTYLQTRPAPTNAWVDVCSLESCDMAHTLSRFNMSQEAGGWELLIRPDATVSLVIWEACPLATMDDAARDSYRGDVWVYDERGDQWLPMRDTTLLNERYPVRLKIDLVTRQDWED